MKKYYVYEIVNLMGTIEYVGKSCNLKARMANHKCINGRFTGRSDIFMNVVADFDNVSDAFDYECSLQTEYGFKSDRHSHTHKSSYGPPNEILVYDLSGNFIGEYPSLCNTSKLLNVNKSAIRSVLIGDYKQCKGYIFKYKVVK